MIIYFLDFQDYMFIRLQRNSSSKNAKYIVIVNDNVIQGSSNRVIQFSSLYTSRTIGNLR